MQPPKQIPPTARLVKTAEVIAPSMFWVSLGKAL